MNQLTISFQKESLDGSFLLPASKSISNRLLILRFLSGKGISIANLSDAEDTRRLGQLLDRIEDYEAQSATDPLVLDTGDAGTVFRFLTALLAVTPGEFILTGSAHMLQRPVGPLVEALHQLGAGIEYAGQTGYPPLRFQKNVATGGFTEMDAGISSQFASALLMIGPRLPYGLVLRLKGKAVSQPYLSMTISLLSRFGVHVDNRDNTFTVSSQPILPGHVSVEVDWSSAAFWYEMAALAPQADILLPGLHKESLQGDKAAVDLFRLLGVETIDYPEGIRISKGTMRHASFELDLSDYPDLVLPFTVACSMLSQKALIKGVGHLQWKESDRLTALSRELSKTGVVLDISQPGIIELPGTMPLPIPTGYFDPWGDHRLAMAFAPLAIPYGHVGICQPQVVEKSYPAFWNEAKKAGFKLTL